MVRGGKGSVPKLRAWILFWQSKLVPLKRDYWYLEVKNESATKEWIEGQVWQQATAEELRSVHTKTLMLLKPLTFIQRKYLSKLTTSCLELRVCVVTRECMADMRVEYLFCPSGSSGWRVRRWVMIFTSYQTWRKWKLLLISQKLTTQYIAQWAKQGGQKE